MARMSIKAAVSAPDSGGNRYCLLPDNERTAYRCAETAANLGAPVEETRVRAYWLHYMTHVESYTDWACGKRLFDPTAHYPDPRDGAIELVEGALGRFCQIVLKGEYDVSRGVPCKYLKRAIKNEFQDIMRRGRHPSREECEQCWQERGMCPRLRDEQPGEQDYRRCYRLPSVEGLEQGSAMFAAAGLQERWPPLLEATEDAGGIQRPVEEQALNGVIIACVRALLPRLLTVGQRIVLEETFLRHKTSREIALMIKTTPGNVDQMRRRGLRRLYWALMS